jgi:ABC-2 type transport system ATP-binding protein
MIEVRGLTKRYGEKLAVNDLTFGIEPGKVTGFLGPNGAGKTTTMRLILGLDYPDAGTVTVNGRKYADLAYPMREVGALLEAKAVHGGRSAYNHLLCLAQTNNLPKRRVGEVLELVGLSDVARKRSKGFSLGMSQRLGIAATLLGDPQVLMFDEPVNGLDPEGILWIRNLMKALASEGRTVFVSSHLMSEMENTADHLIVIGKGELIADCTMAEFIARSSGAAVRVRTPSPDQLVLAIAAEGGSAAAGTDGTLLVRGMTADRVGDVAFEKGIRLHELTTVRASLEEAFMELTADSVEYHAGLPAQAAAASTGSGVWQPLLHPACGCPRCRRRPGGPGWPARSAASSPSCARSARPTGRCSRCSWSASASGPRSAAASPATGRRCRPPTRSASTRRRPACSRSSSSASSSSRSSARWRSPPSTPRG